MLASITPLGERGRNMTWSVTVAFYLVGSVLGGIALGGLAGLAGEAVLRAARPGQGMTLAVLAAAAVVTLIVDGTKGRLRLPTVRRQVNENWLGRYRNWVYGLGFGLQLGLGVATIVTSASVYLMVAVTFFSASITAAVVIGAAFGLGRALPILLTARITTFEHLRRLHLQFAEFRRCVHRSTIAAEAWVCAVAIVVLVSPR